MNVSGLVVRLVRSRARESSEGVAARQRACMVCRARLGANEGSVLAARVAAGATPRRFGRGCAHLHRAGRLEGPRVRAPRVPMTFGLVRCCSYQYAARVGLVSYCRYRPARARPCEPACDAYLRVVSLLIGIWVAIFT